MAVGSAGAMPPAPTSPPTAVVGMGWLATRGELAGDVADGLDQLLGHPTDGGENLAQGEPRQNAPALLNAVLAFAGGPFFQGVVHLVTDPAGLLNCLAH